MKYISTRGQTPPASFEEVLLTGLAPDGGLYVPVHYPTFTPAQIASFAECTYPELAFHIMYPFIEGTIDASTFKQMLEDTYHSFHHHAVAPLQQIGNQSWILELFHGPTLAFKDFALQLLGRLLDHFLQKRNEQAIILGATSGDTGSAAIEGCRHSSAVKIVILHPHNRVSPVQRRQMTTVLDKNVFNVAVEGNFDDCQQIVKALFTEQDFLQKKYRLIAINSINWARLMAQVVYYFYAAVHLGSPATSVNFSVPTGNFGDVFAGYVAKQMGLPIDQLIVATNKNDILDRFFTHNHYDRAPLHPSLSPSMDIQVSSNFERVLFDYLGRDSNLLCQLMKEFTNQGTLSVPHFIFHEFQKLFSSCAVSDEETLNTIYTIATNTGLLIDPHTAIGVYAATQKRKRKDQPMIALATAHPAKFSQAIQAAGFPIPALPNSLTNLLEREEKYTVISNSKEDIKSFVTNIM